MIFFYKESKFIIKVDSENVILSKFIIENQNMVQLQLQVIISRHKESHVPKNNSMPKVKRKLERRTK